MRNCVRLYDTYLVEHFATTVQDMRKNSVQKNSALDNCNLFQSLIQHPYLTLFYSLPRGKSFCKISFQVGMNL